MAEKDCRMDIKTKWVIVYCGTDESFSLIDTEKEAVCDAAFISLNDKIKFLFEGIEYEGEVRAMGGDEDYDALTKKLKKLNASNKKKEASFHADQPRKSRGKGRYAEAVKALQPRSRKGQVQSKVFEDADQTCPAEDTLDVTKKSDSSESSGSEESCSGSSSDESEKSDQSSSSPASSPPPEEVSAEDSRKASQAKRKARDQDIQTIKKLKVAESECLKSKSDPVAVVRGPITNVNSDDSEDDDLSIKTEGGMDDFEHDTIEKKNGSEVEDDASEGSDTGDESVKSVKEDQRMKVKAVKKDNTEKTDMKEKTETKNDKKEKSESKNDKKEKSESKNDKKEKSESKNDKKEKSECNNDKKVKADRKEKTEKRKKKETKDENDTKEKKEKTEKRENEMKEKSDKKKKTDMKVKKIKDKKKNDKQDMKEGSDDDDEKNEPDFKMLRWSAEDDGVEEILGKTKEMLGKKFYISHDELLKVKAAKNASTFAKGLLAAAFTDEALYKCSISGGQYRAGGRANITQKPALHSTTLNVIVDNALYRQGIKNWNPKLSRKEILAGLRQKLVDIRPRLKPQFEEKK